MNHHGPRTMKSLNCNINQQTWFETGTKIVGNKKKTTGIYLWLSNCLLRICSGCGTSENTPYLKLEIDVPV